MAERGITLIALVITIIVLLILAGVSISLVVGNNGVLTQATNAVEKNREAQAREEVEMAWASCETDYWSAWASNSSVTKEEFFLNKIGSYLSGVGVVSDFTYNDGGTSEITYKSNSSADTNPQQYIISADGKVEKKTGVILNKAALSLEPTETETLTAELLELEGKINWEITEGSSSISLSATSGESITVTAVANGTAKITATCGSKSATCNVTVETKLVSIRSLEGKYVNLNIGYVDQMDSTDYTTSTNIKKAWKVLSKDTTTGVVNLISTGHPLTFRQPPSDGELSVTEMNKISDQIITVNASSSRGYTGNGFSTNDNDVKSLFSNTAVFTGIQPARYDVEGVSVTMDTPAEVRTTGEAYWLAKASSGQLVYVRPDGTIGANWNNFGVRLVVSLVSNITITGGSGTDSAPYTLNGITY